MTSQWRRCETCAMSYDQFLKETKLEDTFNVWRAWTVYYFELIWWES